MCDGKCADHQYLPRRSFVCARKEGARKVSEGREGWGGSEAIRYSFESGLKVITLKQYPFYWELGFSKIVARRENSVATRATTVITQLTSLNNIPYYVSGFHVPCI